MALRKVTSRAERRAALGTGAHLDDRGARGRTPASRTPVFLHGGVPDVRIDSSWVRQRLGFKLGKFAFRIDRVDVTTREERGRKGLPGVRVTVHVRAPRYEPFTASVHGASAREATLSATRAVERSIRRRLEKVQTGRTTA